MKIQVIVKPNTKHEKIERIFPGEYRVAVKAPATEGKANEAVVKALASHFEVPKSSVTILHGGKGRKKVVEIR